VEVRQLGREVPEPEREVAMVNSWTIGRKLFTGAAALTALVVVVGLVAWRSSSSIQERLMETGNSTARRLSLSLETQAAIEAVYSAQRAMMLATVARDTAEFTAQQTRLREAMTAANQQLEQLAPLMRAESGRKAVASVRDAMASLDGFQRELDMLLREGKVSDAYQFFQRRGTSLRESSIQTVRVIVANQAKFLASDMETSTRSYGQVRLAILVSSGLALLVSGLFVASVRGMVATLEGATSELSAGAQQVSAASSQVASAAQTLSQGATEQAASLEETSASMEEMASMTRSNAENSLQAASLMKEVDRQVGQSNATLSAMVTSMTAIQDSSAKVSKIIKTIDEIAFQTNILALNAAVEAARAGEAGMGFAVVADEVRSLAHRAAHAARDTASLIEEASTRAQEGSTKVGQVAGSIGAITESVSRVKGLVEQVSGASRQQSQGIDQVTRAVAQMEKVTQSTAATAEESAAASEELSAQAENALNIVERLQLLVDGTTSIEHARTATDGSHNHPGRRRVIAVTKTSSLRRQAEHVVQAEDTGTYGKF
jgi:methyl-accepting chemotaxis protein